MLSLSATTATSTQFARGRCEPALREAPTMPYTKHFHHMHKNYSPPQPPQPQPPPPTSPLTRRMSEADPKREAESEDKKEGEVEVDANDGEAVPEDGAEGVDEGTMLASRQPVSSVATALCRIRGRG